MSVLEYHYYPGEYYYYPGEYHQYSGEYLFYPSEYHYSKCTHKLCKYDYYYFEFYFPMIFFISYACFSCKWKFRFLRFTDRQTDGRTDRQTDQQTDQQTDRHLKSSQSLLFEFLSSVSSQVITCFQ